VPDHPGYEQGASAGELDLAQIERGLEAARRSGVELPTVVLDTDTLAALINQLASAQRRVVALEAALRDTKEALDRERGGGTPLEPPEFLALHGRVRSLLAPPVVTVKREWQT
jgi:hypothetical protein